MSSAKTRLFLTIEKLKNSLGDPQMSYPFWEKFFPLLGTTNTITLEVATLSDLINEAAEVANQLIITQGGAIYSQHIQNAPDTVNRIQLGPVIAGNTTNIASNIFDTKRYHTYVEKITNYFVSASVISTPFTVKDLIKLYLYVYSVAKYKPLYELMEQLLFRKEKECVPIVSPEKTTLVLDSIRDITTITNYRLDYEAMMLFLVNVQKALNNELTKYPQVKVKDYISSSSYVYETEVEPHKAFADKFERLVAQKSSHYVVAADNTITFKSNPLFIENVASNIERNCDINRMVYNSINNIFINAVEQSAAENIKFDLSDYNKRFKILDRVRENLRNNLVDKVAVGDVGTRKRIKTNSALQTNKPSISLKKSRTSNFVDNI